MGRFSKPRRSFNPSNRKMGDQTLERQVLSSQSMRDGNSKSKDWSWKDSYLTSPQIPGNTIVIPPIILGTPLRVTIYDVAELFVLNEYELEENFYVLDDNGNPETFEFYTDSVIGLEDFYVLDDNGNPETFDTIE